MPVLRVGPSTIGRSGQWVRKAGGAVLLLALGCAFAPYAAAHPGHSHGPHADGRLPGQPDLVRKGEQGKIVFRFLPERKEYEVRHPGRPTGYAHVDPLPPGVAASSGEAASVGGWVALPASELDPVCSSSGPRVALVFTHRTADKTPTPKSTLRSVLKRINWKVNDQASQSSEEIRPLKLRADCTEGTINVYDVATSDNAYSTVFSAVEGQLGSQLGSGPIKYLVFDNGTAGEVGGLSIVIGDNKKSWQNGNALNSNVALVYNIGGAWEAHVPLHELLHSMGASQGGQTPAPPKSTSGAHCYDGIDVLCYNDGGGYWSTYCPESEGYEEPANVPIDCGTDTYFDAVPEPESWLDEYWNVAGHENPIMAGAPLAITGDVYYSDTFQAGIEGEIDSGGYDTEYYLEYGPTESYGSKSAKDSLDADEPLTLLIFDINPLNPYTTYHYRLVASNAVGTSYGEDREFETGPGPTVATGEASGIGWNGAQLHGSVNPNGDATTYQFEYGTSTEYGEEIPVSPEAVGSGSEAVQVSEEVEDLEPETTYHFRLTASSEVGWHTGIDRTFTTPAEPPAFDSSFGANGTGNGQLSSPADAEVDAGGNVWVVDKGNNRVQKFNEDGEYISQFGSEGTGNGQLKAPTAIAVDSNGNLWVADGGNHRVQKFSPTGEYLAQFGSQGSGNGQFSSWGPKGIAIDSKGGIWVSDYSSRIQKFNAAGEFVKSVGSYGSGDGQFKESAGIDVGPGNKVWVGDWINDRVSVFSEAGEFLFSFGSLGSGDGQFTNPDGIEVDSKGNVWVLDEGNSRVQQFDQEGEYRLQFGSQGSGEGQFDFAWPVSLNSDDKGNLWVADTGNHRVQRWLIPGYVPNYHTSFGSFGSGDGQLDGPADVAIDASGNLLVVDTANSRVQKFNAEGEYLAQFGSEGTGNGQFKGPISIAIGPSGHIWVVDRSNHRIQKFNAGGEYLSQFGSYGTGNGQFNYPHGIAVDSKGSIWVCDTFNRRVQKFNEAGEFVKAIGSSGVGKGQFLQCNGIDVGPDGRVWAVDMDYDRVNVFNEAGEFLFDFGSFGAEGSGPGQMDAPVGIEVDAQGSVWLGERDNDRVQQFNQDGEYVTQFGSLGSGEGQMKFGFFFGIASDSGGDLWIADEGNDRIQKWSFDPPPPTAATEAASGVSAVGATLNAAVNPRGTATSYQFEYGTTTEYGSKVPGSPGNVGAGVEAVVVDDPIEGLNPATTYHFRVVATSKAGTTYGADKTFKTISPTATTEAASDIGGTEATLNGTVNPQGIATSYQFEYGTTTSYGSKAPASPAGIGTSVENIKVYEPLDGLEPDTTYHFRVVATSEAGTSNGKDMTFLTASPPVVTTKGAMGLGETAATLRAAVNPRGLATNYQFEYGTTTEYGSEVPGSPEEAGSGTANVKVSERVEGLEPGVTYHFRVVATNELGSTYGKDREFTLPQEFPIGDVHLEAEGYPVVLAGSPVVDTFTFVATPIQCGQSDFDTELGGPATELVFDWWPAECATESGFPILVEMNSCEYTLDVEDSGPPYSADFGVACADEGDSVEFKAYSNQSYGLLICTVKVPPQQGLEGVGLANSEGWEGGIEVQVDVEGISYSKSGPCGTGSPSNGTATGETTLWGYGEDEEPIGVYVFEGY